MAGVRGPSRRGMRKALRLAEEQAEARDLARALALVKKCEVKLQAREERAASRDFGPRGRRTRFPEIVAGVHEEKIPRNQISQLINDFKYRLQCGLRRYQLKRLSTATFNMRATRDEFVSLFKGYTETRGSRDGDKLLAIIDKESPQKTTDLLAEILGDRPGRDNWVIRRLCGRRVDRRRDCSFIHIVKDLQNTNLG